MTLIGQPSPDAVFRGAQGAEVKMSGYLGKKTVVLYFYPKNETSGCTAEACSFRDSYEDFKAAGAEVIGVSTDDEASHASFKANHRLPFVLLSDPGGAAAKAFGVKKTLGFIAGRVTFVIDREGVVRHRFDSLLRVHEHVSQALAIVKQLEEKSAA
jgi:thioredoxin-dependent peroxiredoxin